MNAGFSTRHSTRRSTLAIVAICALSGVGCYRYADVAITELTPAMPVRIELSAVAVDRVRRGADSLAKLIDGFTVSGTVSRLSGDSVVLSVPTSYMEANVRLKTKLHDLPLLRTDVQHVRQRRLDRRRTTLVGAGIGAVAIASTAIVLNQGGRSKGSLPKPVDPTDSRVPQLPGHPLP
jgi:hypothetical protein